MPLLTPSEKLAILEAKEVPKKEIERIAALLKSKFRFSVNRPNGNLIETYLAKVMIDDGKVNRNQEYIRRIAKVLDNANTELIVKEIERGLNNKGIYEFKIPSDLMSKAKELAEQIINNGFSFKEFTDWIKNAKAYKTDADDIMQASGVDDMEELYIQLLGTANESVGDNKVVANEWWRSLSSNEMTALLTKHDPYFNKMESHKVASPYNKKKYPGDDLIIMMWETEVAGVDESKELTEDELYDLMSTVDDKLSPEQIQYYYNHPDEIDADKLLSDHEKARLKEEFVNEGRMQIKRPYKRNGIELSPAVTVAEEAVLRNKIVKYLGTQPLFRASKMMLKDFFNSLNEDAEIGRVPSTSWLTRNSHLVKKISVGKDSFYKLTRAGLNLFNRLGKTVNEEELNHRSSDEVDNDLNFAPFTDYLETGTEMANLLSKVGTSNVELSKKIMAIVQDAFDNHGEITDASFDGAFTDAEMEELMALSESNEASTDVYSKKYSEFDPNEKKQADAWAKFTGEKVNPNTRLYFYKDGRLSGAWLKAGEKSESPEGKRAREESEMSINEASKEMKGKAEIGHDEIDIEGLPQEVQDLISSADQLMFADWEGGKGVVSGNKGGKTIWSANVDSTGDKLIILEITGKDAKGKVVDWKEAKPGVNESSEDLQAAKDWFADLTDEEKDQYIDSFEKETGKKLMGKLPPHFYQWLGEVMLVANEAAGDKPYEIMISGGDQELKDSFRADVESVLPDQITDADEGDWSVIIHDEVDRKNFDDAWHNYSTLTGIELQALQNDVPVDLKPHAAMIAESKAFMDFFTVERPTKNQITMYRALQTYLKKHFKAGDDFAMTSTGSLRIHKNIQEKLTPYLKDLDIISPDGNE